MFPFSRKKHSQRERAEEMRQQLSRMEGIEANTKNVQHFMARQNRRMKRAQGNWNSFRYKFTLTPEREQKARAYCEREGLDFEAQWRRFNDNNEPSQATTPQQREAEKKWFPNRIDADPKITYHEFLLVLETIVLGRRVSGRNPIEDDPYANYPCDKVR